MRYDNFLLDAYLGKLNTDGFTAFQGLDRDDQVDEILNHYRQINARHPVSEADDAVPHEFFDELKAIGFFGLTIPARYGGLGLKIRQYLKIVEAISAENMSLGFTALAHLSIGVKGIILFGTEAQKGRYLAPAASGEMIFSYALTEPKTGSDAKHIETTAALSKDGRHYILNGQKTYITNANFAGGLTVFAQMDPNRPGHMGAFIVETVWEGVKIGKDMPKMGLKLSSTAAVGLKNVHVPRENLLGQPGDGFKIAMTILNYGRLALGAASAGMMKQSLKDMNRRSKKRIQFGVPINQFELVQEKMVKARVNEYVASAITAFTAGALDADSSTPVAIESSHCKLFGTTRTWDTLYDAMQVAGGAGYLSTQPYEKRMRDFRVATIFEGTTEIHSIYPALYMVREISKKMKTKTRDRFSQMRFLLKGLFCKTNWDLQLKNPEMVGALKLARSCARRIRILVYCGLLIYGKEIVPHEFLLRRISILSVYVLGILAVLARLEADRRIGRDIDADLKVLGFFAAEANLVRKQSFRLLPNRQEKYHRRIMSDIVGGSDHDAGQRIPGPGRPAYATDDG
jgi:acyl-CoA dehydrogenase family protein 9